MWDVKPYSSSSNFCRAFGFTLTMWDVKRKFVAALNFLTSCFTLTMWDVKQAYFVFVLSILLFEFYLNYVGCKAIPNVSPFTTFETGFTLTMWDVKVFSVNPNISLIVRFYLNYVGCKVDNLILTCNL